MQAPSPPGSVDAKLVAALVRACGREHVISDATTLAVYRSDALTRAVQTPAVAVLPGDADQVAAVVRACADAGVPWVPRGAGTGLSGGALPHRGGVLVVLSRLRRILSVDLADAQLVVEPGVTPAAVNRAVAPSHFYPPDPASRRVCTVGGTVAENAGGPSGLKYGYTGNYVVGLDVVLADGSQVQLRRDAPGYDLLGAFVGSEGTLGVAVAIHLRVVPVPESVRTMVAFFESISHAGQAVSAIIADGIVPSAVELLDGLAMRAAEEVAEAAYRTDAGAALLIELDGPRDESATGLEAVVALCARFGARDVRIALDPTERALLWRTHDVAFTAMRRVASGYDIGDAVVPRPRLGEVLERISALSQEFGLAVAHVVHAGDGNLHPIVCFDHRSSADSARAEELGRRILAVCLDAGGSLAGEHGIGVSKASLMPGMFGPADRVAFEHLRRAFDPRGLVNPGKLTAAAETVRA